MSNTYGSPEEDEKEVRAIDKHLLRVFSVTDHRGNQALAQVPEFRDPETEIGNSKIHT